MRYVYLVDYRDDATGTETQEFYGTEARAKAALRRAGFKRDPEYPNQYSLGDDDMTERAHLHRVAVR